MNDVKLGYSSSEFVTTCIKYIMADEGLAVDNVCARRRVDSDALEIIITADKDKYIYNVSFEGFEKNGPDSIDAQCIKLVEKLKKQLFEQSFNKDLDSVLAEDKE